MMEAPGLGLPVLPTLCQLVYQPPKLDTGSFLSRMAFESPELLILGVVALGFVLLYSFRQADKSRVGIGAATVCVLVAIGLYATSKIVTTSRETVRDLSRELVRSVASADMRRLDELLRDDVIVSPGDSSMRFFGEMDKDATLSAVRGRFGESDGTTLRASQVEASVARAGRATTHVLATGSSSEFGSGRSWWELQWVQTDGRWQVRSIKPLWILGL
ncbi:MAG: nuclear transport factor 2 family protein [Phycisphaeraceae bacterium]|nr:nuclear transport factor 2 family protein [Phycisphaerales bacterium]MCB9859781.1 nuclear transport factor 2 family protein [Phycisphaeraceae bacterium]